MSQITRRPPGEDPQRALPPGPGTAEPTGRDRPLKGALIIALVGALLSTVAALGIWKFTQNVAMSQFRQGAKARAEAIRREARTLEELAYSVVALHDSSQVVERFEFATFVSQALTRHPELRSIVWLRRVPAGQEQELVAEAREQGLSTFQLTEPAPDGQLVPAGRREEYYVTWAAEPQSEAPGLLGFDHGAVPERAEALLRCADTGQMSLTGPVTAVGGRHDPHAVMAFVPIYRHGASTATVPGRRAGLAGFVGATIDVDRLLDLVREELPDQQMDISVYDSTGAEQRLLAFRPSSSAGPAAERDSTSSTAPAELFSEELDLGGRKWRVACTPSEGKRAAGTWEPWVTLGAGLLITALAATSLSTGVSRARVAKLVRARTADLEEANRELATEVEERRRSEERQRLMTRELDHRVKNNMAAVLSIVDHTVRNSESLEQFTEAFSGRIMAMARLHNVLTQSRWSGADLGSLVKQIVEPYTIGHEGRVVVRGEPLTLSSKAVPSVAMALHELATNAAKYGALSAPDGKVDIQWARERGPGGEDQVRMVWTEGGGPPVEEPTRRGFGRDLIEVAVPFEVAGRANLEFARDGVRCVLVIPLGGPPDTEGRASSPPEPPRDPPSSPTPLAGNADNARAQP